MNRQITSRIATYNLAPTPLSKENLLKEGVKEESITVTGNTVIDALYHFPMHLNPNVRKPIREIFGEEAVSGKGNGSQNIFFIEPLEYLPFVFLMEQCTLVLTDSGGIQEEAPGLGKPVLVMRETTERPEAVDAGTVKLVGTNYSLIVKEVSRLLDDEAYYNSMAQAHNPYGDGLACERIIEFIR